MARTNLKAVSVYVTDQQNDQLTKAAASQHRSLSNFLLSIGLQEAENLGFPAVPLNSVRDLSTERKAASV